MAGRDARLLGASAASQSPLRTSASSRASSLPSSATERERLALKEQLEAWREQRESQQQPTTPPKAKPFRAMSSNGPSDEEKKEMLQKRRELMRAPTKPLPLPQKPKRKDSRDDTGSSKGPSGLPTTPTGSVVSASSSSLDAASPAPPRTPPRRVAHQAVKPSGGPAPPRTPPRPTRSSPTNASRNRLTQFLEQLDQRLAVEELTGEAARKTERTPAPAPSQSSDHLARKTESTLPPVPSQSSDNQTDKAPPRPSRTSAPSNNRLAQFLKQHDQRSSSDQSNGEVASESVPVSHPMNNEAPAAQPRPTLTNAPKTRLAQFLEQHDRRLSSDQSSEVVMGEPESLPASVPSRSNDNQAVESQPQQQFQHERSPSSTGSQSVESPAEEQLSHSSPPENLLPSVHQQDPSLSTVEQSAPESTERDQVQTTAAETSSATRSPPPFRVLSQDFGESSDKQRSSSVGPAGGSVQASPVKQVRFADEHVVHVDADRRREGGVENNQETSVAALHDSTCELSVDEPSNQLTDSQSSLEQEMRDREHLLTEVDELIHHRTEDVVVTDYVRRRHTAADGHEETEETVLRSHTKETTNFHTVETVIDDRSPLVIAPALLTDDDQQVLSGIAIGDGRSDVKVGEDLSPDRTGKTRVAKSLHVEAATEGPLAVSLLPLPASTSAVRKTIVASVFLAGLLAIDLLVPHSPVSRIIRVAKRIFVGSASYMGSRTALWLLRNVVHPTIIKTCDLAIGSNSWLQPRAEALQSLLDSSTGRGMLSRLGIRFDGTTFELLEHRAHVVLEEVGSLRSDAGETVIRASMRLINGISSAVADIVLFAASPLMRPLPTVNPETTVAAQNRLKQLADVQLQLRSKVKDLMRTQEEWALEELERMKQRRVAYATATESILTQTTQVMLKAVEDAKLSAAEHIEEFTDQLARELMSSIQPELDEYERLEADSSREQANQEAMLQKVSLEEAARLEILRVEAAKRQAAMQIEGEFAKDRKSLLEDKVFVEVDVLEVVETVEEAIKDEVEFATSTVADSLEGTFEDVESIVEVAETELEAVVDAVEGVIERAEKQLADEVVATLTKREEELQLKHDAAEAEILLMMAEEVKRLQIERTAAEELARAALLAEEALEREADEARRVLDAELLEAKIELEREAMIAADAAVNIEVVEVENIAIEEEVIKQEVESEIIDDVKLLVRDVEQVESEAVGEVETAELELTLLEEKAESTLDQLAADEVKRLEREQAVAMERLNIVAADIQQQIAASAGIDPRIVPSTVTLGPVSSKPNDLSSSLRSITEQAERRHMMLLSIGFAVLALATAFVLYPRWRRLVVKPKRDTKSMSALARRRRRRSWQRPAQVTDSEPEEVMLLQTASSSDDGLSDEPEPEVVELMSGGGSAVDTRTSYATSTRTTTYTSYSRALDFGGEGEQQDEANNQEEEELVTPPPTRRALRRRRH